MTCAFCSGRNVLGLAAQGLTSGGIEGTGQLSRQRIGCRLYALNRAAVKHTCLPRPTSLPSHSAAVKHTCLPHPASLPPQLRHKGPGILSMANAGEGP